MASSKEKRKEKHGHFWQTVGETIIVFLWLSVFVLAEFDLWWWVVKMIANAG